MPDSLPDLEARCSKILLEIAQLGDLRRGAVHASFRHCDEPYRACASDNHPGQGPQVHLPQEHRGKTGQQRPSTPAQIHKTEREVATFRHFRQLSAELVAGQRAPVPAAPAPGTASAGRALRSKENAARHPRRRPS